MKEIILLTTIHEGLDEYSERDSRVRAMEFEECLANNCKTRIDRIIVFFEGQDVSGYPSLSHEKVEVVFIRKRPKYELFFDYANKHLAGNFVIVSNADIYFDPKTPVSRVREIKPGYLWALSRYNLDRGSGVWKLGRAAWEGSYDSYIFYAPLKKFKSDFLLGVMGCDSYLVQKAIEASIPVSNPCLSLVSRHVEHLHSPHLAPCKSEFSRIHSYWKKPDYGGYPSILYYPRPFAY